jgi:hypothetical protein
MDVDSFTFGIVSVQASLELHQALATIIYYTLFMFEMILARALGKKVFSRMIEEFLKSVPGSKAVDTVGARWPYIQARC